MVSTASIAAMAVTALICFLGPIALAVIWKKRTGARIYDALMGAATFVVFVYIFEGACHSFILGGKNGAAITGNPWLYAAYGGIMAGLFEETGRFLTFRFFLKKENHRSTGVMYGIGHGGIEAILIAGMGMISNLAVCAMINNGMSDLLISSDTTGAVAAAITALQTSPWYVFLVSALERAAAVTLHISLSVMVFAAVRQGRAGQYFIAIFIHAFVDFFAGLYQTGLITSMAVIELVVIGLSVLAAVYAYRLYKSWPEQGESSKAAEEAYTQPEYAGDEMPQKFYEPEVNTDQE